MSAPDRVLQDRDRLELMALLDYLVDELLDESNRNRARFLRERLANLSPAQTPLLAALRSTEAGADFPEQIPAETFEEPSKLEELAAAFSDAADAHGLASILTLRLYRDVTAGRKAADKYEEEDALERLLRLRGAYPKALTSEQYREKAEAFQFLAEEARQRETEGGRS